VTTPIISPSYTLDWEHPLGVFADAGYCSEIRIPDYDNYRYGQQVTAFIAELDAFDRTAFKARCTWNCGFVRWRKGCSASSDSWTIADLSVRTTMSTSSFIYPIFRPSRDISCTFFSPPLKPLFPPSPSPQGQNPIPGTPAIIDNAALSLAAERAATVAQLK
jgi:hypothetical protein